MSYPYTVDSVIAYLEHNQSSYAVDALQEHLMREGCPQDILDQAIARLSPFTVTNVTAYLERNGSNYTPTVLHNQLRTQGCPQAILDQATLLIASSPTRISTGYDTLRRLSTYETLSGIFWIVLGILQCLTIFVFYLFGPVIGIWNIVAGISRLTRAPRILARDSNIPQEHEGLGGLIAIGVTNLLIGGVIGIVFVILDFIIRDKILANRHLFTAVSAN